MQAEDAGGVVGEDGNLVGTQVHCGMQIAECGFWEGRICALLAEGVTIAYRVGR
jgi:hypothetical protein